MTRLQLSPVIQPFSSPAATLGPWLVDTGANRIARNGIETRLTPKAMFVLRCLMARPMQPVTRESLLDTVWPDADVTEEVLTQVVAELRRALSGDADGTEAIETIRKVGYRLRLPVQPLDRLPEPALEGDWLHASADVGPGAAPAAARMWRLDRRMAWRVVVVVVSAWVLVTIAVRSGLWTGPGADPGGSASAWSPPRPLTSDIGSEYAPALSPNGASVAYLAGGGNDVALSKILLVRSVGATSSIELASAFTGRGDIGPPAWQPDSRRLAYQRIEGNRCRIVSQVVVGGMQSERFMGECEALDGLLRELHWSPDGRDIAFSRRLLPQDPASPVRIHLLDVSTGTVRALDYAIVGGESALPRYSPAGDWIAFVHGVPGDYALYAVPARGGTPRRLATADFRLRGADWMPDGKSLVAANRDGLWQVAIERSPPRALGIAKAMRPSIARASPVMVFATPPDARLNLRRYVLDPAEDPAERIGKPAETLFASTRRSWSPRWSPRGDTIAFVSDRNGDEQVWLGDLRDGQVRQLGLLTRGASVASIAWLPDASAILLAYDDPDGAGHVAVLGADGSPPRSVFELASRVAAAAPSSDGHGAYVAGATAGSPLLHVALDGGTPRSVPLHDVASLADPGDGFLYFARSGDAALYRATVDGRDAGRLGDLDRVSAQSGWTLVADGAVVWARVEGGEALMLIGRDGRSAPRLFAGMIGNFGQYEFAVAPDAMAFIMVAQGTREMDLMITEMRPD